MKDEPHSVALALRLSGHDVLSAVNRLDGGPLSWRVTCLVGNVEVQLNCRSAAEVFAYFDHGQTPREYYVNTRPQ